jgi:hypothetical protein
MKTIISRLTMKKNGEWQEFRHYLPENGGFLFDKIYTYVDKYGDKYDAFSPFYFWSWRRVNKQEII